MKTIEITVDSKGESRVEMKGFQGSECRQAGAFVEKALGRVTAEPLTAEYHVRPETRAGLNQSR